MLMAACVTSITPAIRSWVQNRAKKGSPPVDNFPHQGTLKIWRIEYLAAEKSAANDVKAPWAEQPSFYQRLGKPFRRRQ
jgi:hypothetical protein